MERDARRRIRSRVHIEILKALAKDVAAPVLMAELYRLLTLRQHLTPSKVFEPDALRPYYYRYLYRLADRGLVKIHGLRRSKRVLLTEKGLKALREIDSAGGRERAASEAPESSFRRLHRRHRSKPSADKFRAFRKDLAGLIGPGRGWAVFLSYDIPEVMRGQRNKTSRVLREGGFLHVNGSFYIGPPNRLGDTLESLGDLEVLPYCCWGQVRLLPA